MASRLGAAERHIERAVHRAVEAGLEIGLQVAVERDGQPAVSICAGHADERRTRPVYEDTLFCVFSATKGIAATALQLQVARGRLSWGDPVARHWPEFGVGGKQNVLVRDVLRHQAGIPRMPRPTSVEQMCDWSHMVKAIAALERPSFPGAAMAYHGYTFGWLVGELVSRTDTLGRPFERFVGDELSGPLGVRDDLWLGVPDDHHSRIADIVDYDPMPPAPRGPRARLLGAVIPRALRPSREVFARADVRRACLPAVGGHMTAGALAHSYSVYLPAGRGIRRPEMPVALIEMIEADIVDGFDVVLGRKIRRANGFLAAARRWPDLAVLMGTSPRAFGHSGAGGSIGWVDRSARLTAAITKTSMTVPDARPKPHLLAIARAIAAYGAPG